MKIPQKLKSIYVTAPALCLVAYLARVKGGQVNYFRDLALAFLHCRLHVIAPPQVEDLVLYHGRYYLYWPPVPAIVFTPLVALFGYDLPDGIISSFIGVGNVWLFMKICGRLSQQFLLGLRSREIFWAGLLWGLGTVHWYMAKQGEVWVISQVIGQAFLLSAIYFFLRNRCWWRSGLCFALAVYSRNDLILSAPFFVALHLALNPGVKPVAVLRPALLFSIPVIICSGLNGWYNYARFGSPFNNGIAYHLMADYFRESYSRWGYLSLHYIPHNFYTEVLHAPTLITENPFIKEEPEGFGFLWASPFFFWLIPALGLWLYRLVRGNAARSYRLMTAGSLASAVCIAFIIFMVMGTGWRQFGARYTLDFQVFLLLFLLFSWPALVKIRHARPVSVVIISLSFLIQLIGAS